ncbi:cytochrome o ubiquinol oxidase subunit I [Salipiger aestuarii]|uniref:Cytochrome o ubiquinol oxidase subunit 1 n=1 Tax=Salipiger aestuarii TaxID=568098 RepID=A0A327XZP6_9RHOB|nr:cytochrome o ubiquinol oxidase subunit I [Salipiger aestuarii]EIE50212.1 cytochrome o ubiquinol oxidase, subunit I [Citreicella sp. 357]KAA8606940.1 cytochrome o ubiquinol oxidase subunit I [Salipiger aestuarii]KAA8610777.1 cytochrome o ubiquinol oxidase subunit I [Salipiger aestuarii]KAB2541561.1 cytochrome o ubiquinol oxidase subunit I [Salipiger aestuarii]RAK14250.1 cytochrome o ubiquinol oxidase subunit 1 [Salipiger aestuarii]
MASEANSPAETFSPIFGRLTLDWIPYHEPILIGTFAGIALGGLILMTLMTYFRLWGPLWSNWVTSVDHKKIGIMYMVLGFVMMVRGFADALMMRAQQAMAAGGAEGYLPPHHYDQVFTAHGVIMIFFVAMPFVTGVMNYVMPLQIGARDVAFPFLNNFSFWMTVAGALLVNVSLFVGEFARVGWLAFPPLSGASYSTGPGMDYYLWALQIAGVGTTLSGINLIATILKMRAPGMKLFDMPIFTWTALVTNVLIVAAFPVLTATLALLTLDRYLGFHFFTNDFGGNAMMYINLIWIWGHPEVYILIIPCFGIISEIVSTFSGKPIFGYRTMVWATACIMVLSFVVWLHHFFTMGSGASVNTFFGITTMIIAVPTGVKIFNWLFTMYKGRVRFELPMLWAVGFLVTFTIGGMTGVMLAIPPVDFQLHNTLFLIAHFHNVIIGGVVFAIYAGVVYWWPKAFGFKLNETWGRRAFWGWFIGFYVAFMPLYALGLMGVTRRMNSYPDAGWQPYFIVAAIGAVIILLGILSTFVCFYVSIRDRKALAVGNDPWDARTLEWATQSPPAPYNFPHDIEVVGREAFWRMKRHGFAWSTDYAPIHMPKGTATGVILSAVAFVFGFAMVWYVWWLAALTFVAMIAIGIGHTFNYNRDYDIPVDEVRRTEAKGALA